MHFVFLCQSGILEAASEKICSYGPEINFLSSRCRSDLNVELLWHDYYLLCFYSTFIDYKPSLKQVNYKSDLVPHMRIRLLNQVSMFDSLIEYCGMFNFWCLLRIASVILCIGSLCYLLAYMFHCTIIW